MPVEMSINVEPRVNCRPWEPSPRQRTAEDQSGDTTPCRMAGVTLHSHVHYKEIYLQNQPVDCRSNIWASSAMVTEKNTSTSPGAKKSIPSTRNPTPLYLQPESQNPSICNSKPRNPLSATRNPKRETRRRRQKGLGRTGGVRCPPLPPPRLPQKDSRPVAAVAALPQSPPTVTERPNRSSSIL